MGNEKSVKELRVLRFDLSLVSGRQVTICNFVKEKDDSYRGKQVLLKL
jgi:hypothetical protein